MTLYSFGNFPEQTMKNTLIHVQLIMYGKSNETLFDLIYLPIPLNNRFPCVKCMKKRVYDEDS